MRKESLKKDGSKNGMADDQETIDGLNNESSANVETNNENGKANVNSSDPLDVDEPTGTESKGKRAKTKAAKKVVEEETTPPAPIDNGDTEEEEIEDYEVEDIVDHKIERKRVLFLVRWKNYGSSDDTWEPESSLSCPDIIAKYREAHPEVVTAAGKRKANSVDKAASETSSVTAEKSNSKKKSRKSVTVVVAESEQDSGKGEQVASAADEEEYEVDEIVSHKVERKKNVFLIRWKGYGADADTWEKEDSLSCPEIVSKYKKENEGKFAEDKLAQAKAAKEARANKEYEVSRIMDTRKVRGDVYYLIHWKNCKSTADSWEREDKVNCPELIEKFKKAQLMRRSSPHKRLAKNITSYDTDLDPESDEDEDEVIPKKKQRGDKPVAAPAKEEFEVEKIVDDKVEKGQQFYLVKWKGYPTSQNTWQSKSSLACPALLKAYTAKAPATPVKAKTSVEKLKRKSITVSTPSKKKTPSKKGSSTSLKKTARKASPKSAKKSAAKVTVEEEEEPDWEVEQITDVKYNDDGSKNFLIRWKGCDSSQDTWEPESNLSCPALINKFMNKIDDADSKPKKKSSRK